MNRANYIVVEESRLVPKNILDEVILPFLEVRTPPYKSLPEYMGDKDLNEEGRISYITSAWYKSEPWFEGVKKCILRVASGDKTASFLAFDYLTTVYHNIKTKAMIRNETSNMDKANIDMEYRNLPSGSSGSAYFKFSLFKRNLEMAFYPQREQNYNKKFNPYAIPKANGEIRIISIDVATRANKANDNSIISCVQMIPTKKGYERHLAYMESHLGQHVGIQAERIKEMFYDFEANYIVLDLMSVGIKYLSSFGVTQG